MTEEISEAVYTAFLENDILNFKKLIKENEKNIDFNSAAMQCYLHNICDLGVLKYLLEKGCDPNTPEDKQNLTLLHSICRSPDITTAHIDLVLNYIHNINAKTCGNFSALAYACTNNNLKVVLHLLSKKAHFHDITIFFRYETKNQSLAIIKLLQTIKNIYPEFKFNNLFDYLPAILPVHYFKNKHNFNQEQKNTLFTSLLFFSRNNIPKFLQWEILDKVKELKTPENFLLNLSIEQINSLTAQITQQEKQPEKTSLKRKRID